MLGLLGLMGSTWTRCVCLGKLVVLSMCVLKLVLSMCSALLLRLAWVVSMWCMCVLWLRVSADTSVVLRLGWVVMWVCM